MAFRLKKENENKGYGGLAIRVLSFTSFLIVCSMSIPLAHAQSQDEETITISVVVANPSKEKTQTIPVKIDLPQEVTPEDIIDKGDLEVQYDDQKSSYFLYNKAVELKPKQTRVFEVQVKNVWKIPQEEIGELSSYAEMLIKKLEGSDYYESGKRLYDLAQKELSEIKLRQSDENLGQKQRIGAYRLNRKAMEQIKQYLEKMEKILSFQGGPPVPEMLQESKLKSDAPSTKTTWLIIFAVLFFVGLLGLQFFYTWHKRAMAEKSSMDTQRRKLPGNAPVTGPEHKVA